jgi:hypothetical protein
MEFNTVYGYIKVDRDYEKSVEFIKSLGKDQDYPFVNTNMFSFGDNEIPYYYECNIFSFAATYKYFGLEIQDWNSFILKIENILRNIGFESAQFHIDGAINHYTLFWTKTGPSLLGEENHREYIEKYCLTKTHEWYFGFGRRHVFTGSIDKDEFYMDLRDDPDFKYPIPSN